MDHSPYLCKGMNTKLYRALIWRDAKFLDRVLKEGSVHVLQEVTPTEDTALHIAAFCGRHLQAEELIRLAVDDPEAGRQFLRAQNREGNTALHVAAKTGCEKIVKMLVETDSDLARVKNNRGETALFKASENGHVRIVERLLEKTAEELDARADGRTPLHVAVANLHKDVTDMLLEKRPALAEKADDLQRTALHVLALRIPMTTIGYWSIRRNISKIGVMLLRKDVWLTYRVDVKRQSALHLAAKVGNYPLVQTILRNSTDCTHISDRDGRTPLHLAVESASQVYNKIGRAALRYTISSLVLPGLIDCSDKNRQTALDIAIHKTKEDPELFSAIQSFLRRHGASRKMYEREDSSLSPRRPRRTDIVSINAVLIATVAFAAAFTLPGDIDSNKNPPIPSLLNVSLFKLFVLLDSLAFVISVGSAVLLVYASGSRQEDDDFLADLCFGGVWAAVTSLALAFGAAIHLVVASKCLWLAVLVWLMVCSLPIGVRLCSLLGKRNTFLQPRQIIMVVIFIPMLVMSMIYLIAIGLPLVLGATIVWAIICGIPLGVTKSLRRLIKIVRRRMRRQIT